MTRKFIFATLVDLCHLKNSRRTEQGAAASHRTTAKVLEVISRVPGCSGQASDAVSAHAQVEVKDAPELLHLSVCLYLRCFSCSAARSGRQRCARRSASVRGPQVSTPPRPSSTAPPCAVSCSLGVTASSSVFKPALRHMPATQWRTAWCTRGRFPAALHASWECLPWQSSGMPHGCLLRVPLCEVRAQMLLEATLGGQQRMVCGKWWSCSHPLRASRWQSLHNRPWLDGFTCYEWTRCRPPCLLCSATCFASEAGGQESSRLGAQPPTKTPMFRSSSVTSATSCRACSQHRSMIFFG